MKVFTSQCLFWDQPCWNLHCGSVTRGSVNHLSCKFYWNKNKLVGVEQHLVRNLRSTMHYSQSYWDVDLLMWNTKWLTWSASYNFIHIFKMIHYNRKVKSILNDLRFEILWIEKQSWKLTADSTVSGFGCVYVVQEFVTVSVMLNSQKHLQHCMVRLFRHPITLSKNSPVTLKAVSLTCLVV